MLTRRGINWSRRFQQDRGPYRINAKQRHDRRRGWSFRLKAATAPFSKTCASEQLIEKTAVQRKFFEIECKGMFTHACKVRLEGVVSKVRDNRRI